MRGDVIFRVYGLHGGREKDSFFGAYRTQARAEAEITKLLAKEMHGDNWARRYHDRGFVIRQHVVETDFEVPTQPKPRDAFIVETALKLNEPGAWDSTLVEVLRRRNSGNFERICGYERNHGMYETFEPFRQGSRELALISRDYTKTAVLDLASGEILAEETETVPGNGFCPVGFYVPDWWDVNDDSVIPGSEYWSADDEWPTGAFGFVWGCYWGDDTSWKIEYLDLARVQQGVLGRDDRFGYVPLASCSSYGSPCLRSRADRTELPSRPPEFIDVRMSAGKTRARFAVGLDFDLESGRVHPKQHAALVSDFGAKKVNS